MGVFVVISTSIRLLAQDQKQSYDPQAAQFAPGIGMKPSYYSRNIEMGFRFSPSISTNTIEADDLYAGTVNNGAAIRMSIGPYADLFFADNYAFGTGVFYTVKRVSVLTPKSFPKEKDVLSEGSYNLQYIQVPLTIKLFAGELIENTRLYLQFGGLAEVKIAEKPIEKNVNALYRYYLNTTAATKPPQIFSFADLGALVGLGVEHEIGGDLRLLLGISYSRGLTDVMLDKSIILKNNVFMLDLGMKF